MDIKIRICLFDRLAEGTIMETTRLTPETLDAIGNEHEALTEFYEQILNTLQEVPCQRLPACALLDQLAEKLDKHFMHEEEGGYYSHVLEIAPWRAATVEELKRQHADLSRAVAQIARGARVAEESLQSWAVVRKDFDAFLRRCVEHEANEERVIQETYLLDVAAAE